MQPEFAGLKLYHYWRSTSSWRVRFAFALKRVPVELIAVNLLGGESEQPDHLARNAMGHVPVLEIAGPEGPLYLAESLAILEWIEETCAGPSLISGDPWRKGRIRQLAELINAGTQPLINLGVAQKHSQDPAQQKAWNQYWIRNGLKAFELTVRETAGKYCMGDEITLADICLIPQCYSAVRNEVSLEEFPILSRVNATVLAHEACQRSHPDRYSPKD